MMSKKGFHPWFKKKLTRALEGCQMGQKGHAMEASVGRESD